MSVFAMMARVLLERHQHQIFGPIVEMAVIDMMYEMASWHRVIECFPHELVRESG